MMQKKEEEEEDTNLENLKVNRLFGFVEIEHKKVLYSFF